MSLHAIAHNQGGFLRKKLSGGLPHIGLLDSLGVLALRRNRFFSRLQLLERDDGARIGLYRIPYFGGDMWFPVATGHEADYDIWLDLADRYHGGPVGASVGRGDVVLDCGGYAGQFALWATSREADRVVVFEPDPRNLECVRRNCAVHIESGRISVVDAAVSVSSGSALFHFDGSGNAGSMSTAFASGLDRDPVEASEVRTVTIDSAVRALGLDRVDFVKMDIEGAERDAIRGGAETLARDLPELAVCTYHLPDDREVIPRVLSTISDGYGATLKKLSYPLIDIWIR